jgi:hypothetical protein
MPNINFRRRMMGRLQLHDGFGADFLTGQFFTRPPGGSVTRFVDAQSMFSWSASAKLTRRASGLLVGSAVNTRGYVWDSSGNALGISVEGAFTNSIRQNENPADVAWEVNGGTKSLDGTNPYGVAGSMGVVTEDSGTSKHRIAYGATSIAGTAANWTMNVWVRRSPSARRYVMIHAGGAGGATNAWAVFDTQAGTFSQNCTTNGAWTAVRQEIENWGTDLWRISITFTATAIQIIPIIQMSAASSVANPDTYSYTGDGASTLCYWGMNLGPSSWMSSHVPTTSSSVTRNADVISRAVDSPINPVEGVWRIKYNQPFYDGNSFALVTIAPGDGRVFWKSASTSGAVLDGTATRGTVTLPALGVNDTLVTGYSAVGNYCRIRSILNPAAPSSGIFDGSMGVVSPTTLELGARGGAFQPFATIQSIDHWPYAMTSAEEQALCV